MENVIRTLINEEQVSLTLANTTEIVRRAQQLHGMGKSSTEVLGKFLSAAVYMSAALKEESGEISFALHSNGLGKQINVSGNHALFIRGYIEKIVEKAGGMSAKNENFNGTQVFTETDILGTDGSFTVIRDDGYSRPFVGSCAFPTEISVDGILEEYYRISEQLPTYFASVVEFDEKEEVAFAGIGVLQPLPFTSAEVIDSIPKGAELKEIVKEMRNVEAKEVAIRNFSAKPDGIKGKKATYTCNCSRAYLMQVLTSLGEEQMRSIIREDGAVRVHCHYCNTDYTFGDEDADMIFKKKKDRK